MTFIDFGIYGAKKWIRIEEAEKPKARESGTEPGFEPGGGQSSKQLFFFNENKKLTPISYSTKYYI